MITALWHRGEVPANIPISQVYGILINNDGKILLFKDGESFSLPGGRPETSDDGIEGTLRREVIEEVNVTIDTPYMIGYRLIDEENGKEPYAQVRMTALIKEIGQARPDSAYGRTYKRYLVTPPKAIELLDWKDDGEAQILSAVEAAKKHLNISWCTDDKIIEV